MLALHFVFNVMLLTIYNIMSLADQIAIAMVQKAVYSPLTNAMYQNSTCVLACVHVCVRVCVCACVCTCACVSLCVYA